MKALTILSIVQTALLVLLFSRTMMLESELAELSASSPIEAAENSYPTPQNRPLGVANSEFDEERLRRIIRDELDAHSFAIADSSSEAAYVAPIARDPIQEQQQLDYVTGQLEYYASVGTISEADMAKLQSEIGRLDESGRQEMLRKLTQAMNSGAIKGRF